MGGYMVAMAKTLRIVGWTTVTALIERDFAPFYMQL